MLKLPDTCRIYGPYLRKDGRKHVVVLTKDETGAEVERQTISYPKFLVEGILLKELATSETIDHIDNDFTNDDPSNLRVLPRKEHAAQDALRLEQTTVPCQQCGNSFIPRKDQRNKRANESQRAGPFCTKSCASRYNATARLPTTEVQRTSLNLQYYRSKRDICN